MRLMCIQGLNRLKFQAMNRDRTAQQSPSILLLEAPMSARTTHHRLQVDAALAQFIDTEVLPGTGISPASFWAGFDAIAHDLAPKNRALLAERDRLQAEIDAWHEAHPGPIADMPAYKAFLTRIGYLVEPRAGPGDHGERGCRAGTAGRAATGGAILNARYALNAANARWGSLYDALYGTDALPSLRAHTSRCLQPVRGAQVIAYARRVLDQAAPLAVGTHADAVGYRVEGGQPSSRSGRHGHTPGRPDRLRRLPGRCRQPQQRALRPPRPAPGPAHRP